MVDISIIVPVYNIEKYLSTCLDSLLNQTHKNIEIIVVNDGSPDNSQQIIDEYVARDTRIVSLVKENGGLSDARNFGMKYATGKYIGFIDGDDYAEHDIYEKMYVKAIEEGSNIVECNLFHNYPDKFDVEIGDEIYDKHEMIRVGRSVVWNKIYNRDWLMKSNVRFSVGMIHEDVEFYVKLVPFISKISYIKEAGIHYVFRRESIMNRPTRKMLDIFSVFEHLVDYYKRNGYYEEYRNDIEYLATRITLGNTVKRIARIEDKKERKWVADENWKRLNKLFPDWKNNPCLREGKSKKEYYMKTMTQGLYQMYVCIFSFISCLKDKSLQ